MNHTPAQVIAQLLQDNAIFAAHDGTPWPLFVSSMPETPDQAGCLYDTSPVLHGFLQKTRAQMQHWSIQLRVRSISYDDGWVKAQDALENLIQESFDVVTVAGSSYTIQAIVPATGVVALGVEQEGTKRRNLFTVNFLVALS